MRRCYQDISNLWIFRSKQPESLLVLHGSVVSPCNDGGKNFVSSEIKKLRHGESRTSTLEKKHSTPNNTINYISSNPSTELTRPNVVMSSSSTLERPAKLLVNRNIELLLEKGHTENIAGRSRQSVHAERRVSSPIQPMSKATQNHFELEPEVYFN